jgi:hypothetical protein
MFVHSGALDAPAHYFSWGWLSVSLPNLVMVLVMITLFVLALLLPFPRERSVRKDRS